MKGSSNESLGIGDDDVRPMQNILFGLAWSHGRFVTETRLGQATICSESVSANCAAQCDSCLGEGLGATTVQSLDGLNLGETRFAGLCKSHRHKGFDPACTAAPFAWVGRSKVRFVEFHDAVQFVLPITVGHCGPNLVGYQPCPVIGDCQLLAQLKCRVPTFVPGGQENRPEPLLERCTSTMEHRSRQHRSLASAGLALPQGARLDHPRRRGTTPWA